MCLGPHLLTGPHLERLRHKQVLSCIRSSTHTHTHTQTDEVYNVRTFQLTIQSEDRREIAIREVAAMKY